MRSQARVRLRGSAKGGGGVTRANSHSAPAAAVVGLSQRYMLYMVQHCGFQFSSCPSRALFVNTLARKSSKSGRKRRGFVFRGAAAAHLVPKVVYVKPRDRRSSLWGATVSYSLSYTHKWRDADAHWANSDTLENFGDALATCPLLFKEL